MRYVIVTRGAGGRMWVVAETPDEAYALEAARSWAGAAIPKDEATLHPDFADAVAAWDSGDDSVHVGELAIMDAETRLETAMHEAVRDGLIDKSVLEGD